MPVHETVDDARVGFGKVGVDLPDLFVELHLDGVGQVLSVGADVQSAHPVFDVGNLKHAAVLRVDGVDLRRFLAVGVVLAYQVQALSAGGGGELEIGDGRPV